MEHCSGGRLFHSRPIKKSLVSIHGLELGLKIKQRLWETLCCPSLVETEQPDGRILITISFSTNNRSFTPRIHADISEEPLPEEP
ncbi:hypothetical protein G5714_012458 [Onychostoma macrolepis]|uniref:Uncharacterized protein n=1 Tax=Onychostoma macrolepis TaxID=369639 RepID=A0A7J6CGK8_9TELE|nr:hypothetical protein G5714_012458 [Onychostoma macrolepis]